MLSTALAGSRPVSSLLRSGRPRGHPVEAAAVGDGPDLSCAALAETRHVRQRPSGPDPRAGGVEDAARAEVAADVATAQDAAVLRAAVDVSARDGGAVGPGVGVGRR